MTPIDDPQNSEQEVGLVPIDPESGAVGASRLEAILAPLHRAIHDWTLPILGHSVAINDESRRAEILEYGPTEFELDPRQVMTQGELASLPEEFQAGQEMMAFFRRNIELADPEAELRYLLEHTSGIIDNILNQILIPLLRNLKMGNNEERSSEEVEKLVLTEVQAVKLRIGRVYTGDNNASYLSRYSYEFHRLEAAILALIVANLPAVKTDIYAWELRGKRVASREPKFVDKAVFDEGLYKKDLYGLRYYGKLVALLGKEGMKWISTELAEHMRRLRGEGDQNVSALVKVNPDHVDATALWKLILSAVESTAVAKVSGERIGREAYSRATFGFSFSSFSSKLASTATLDPDKVDEGVIQQIQAQVADASALLSRFLQPQTTMDTFANPADLQEDVSNTIIGLSSQYLILERQLFDVEVRRYADLTAQFVKASESRAHDSILSELKREIHQIERRIMEHDVLDRLVSHMQTAVPQTAVGALYALRDISAPFTEIEREICAKYEREFSGSPENLLNGKLGVFFCKCQDAAVCEAVWDKLKDLGDIRTTEIIQDAASARCCSERVRAEARVLLGSGAGM